MDNPQRHFEKLFQKQLELTKRLEQFQYWKHPKVLEFIKKSNELISDLDNQISIEVQKEIDYQNFIKERQKVQDSIKNQKPDDTLYSFEIEKLNLDNKTQTNSQQNETNHSMQKSNKILENVLSSQKNSDYSNQKQVPSNQQQLVYSNNTVFYSTEDQNSMLQKQQKSQFNDKQEQNQMRSSLNKQSQQQNQQQNQFESKYNQQQYQEQPIKDEKGQSLYYSIPPNNNQQDYQQEYQYEQSKNEKYSQQQKQQEQDQLKSRQSQQQYISQQQQKNEYKIDSEIDQFQEITNKKDENKSANSIKQQNSLDYKGSPIKKNALDKQKEIQEYLIKEQNDLIVFKKEKQQNNNQIFKAQYQNQQYDASITLDQNKQSEVLDVQNTYQQQQYPQLSPLQNQKKITIQELSNSKQSKNRQQIQQQKILYQYNVDQKMYMQMKEHQKKFGFTIVNDKVYEDDGDECKCSICLCGFFTDQVIQESYTVQLNCKHKFHYNCLMHIMKESFLKCPNCNHIIGQTIGDQPDGSMETRIIQRKCKGYDCNTIEIRYDFPGRKRNGVYFTGTNRTAYLPNNSEGQKVLELLRRAFQQKLTFTVGRSVTTGKENSVIWNGIHHKTSLDGGPTAFGYPDPTYFERVTQELKERGIV